MKEKNNAIEKIENIENGNYEQEVKTEQQNADERIERAREKKQKKERRKQIKLQKKQEKKKKKKENKNVGGYITAIVSLGIATLVLASALTFVFIIPSKNDTMLEAGYRRSFYDAVEQVDNMDLNLSKILASKDKGAIQTYLVDLAINSELCENDLQSLPLEDENKFYTTKAVNQIGDYAKYLNKKLNNGGEITESDTKALNGLYSINLSLKEALNDTANNMQPDFSFSVISDGEKENVLLDNFTELENLSVEYPELIYDGPFSDGKDEREIKGLSENLIDENKAREIFISYFSDFNIKNIESQGMLEGNLRCFNFTGEINGESVYGQISERDGKLITYENSGSCKETLIDEDTATETGLEFLAKMEAENMKPVWINLSNNVYTINFASSVNDIIIYSDLIKIRVCAENGVVIGVEASSYYQNHTEREIMPTKLDRKSASEKVADNLEINSSRICVIPIGESSEALCYEFMCKKDDQVYYVYIDAENGRQVQMFKVIEGTEGQLLM